jgi:hypothetical protein
LAGHVFVEGYYGHVYRYPLTNGRPAAQPDLAFPSNSGGIVAVGRSGEVYISPLTGPSGFVVNVYRPGKTAPQRTLNVGSGCIEFPVSMAVDYRGNLAISYAEESVERVRQSPPCGTAIAVYGPGASGDDPPLASIAFPFLPYAEFQAYLTFDGEGDIISENLGDNDTVGIATYENPTTTPTLVRQFFDSQITLSAHGLAATPYDHGVWVLVSSTVAARYAALANGDVEPAQTIEAVGGRDLGNQIAVDRDYLYAFDVSDRRITVYHQRHNGPQLPFASVLLPNVSNLWSGVAIGP